MTNGGRRHRLRLAEGPDAAARPRLQRRLREGAGGVEEQQLPKFLLGLGGDDRLNAGGFFPYTPATNLLYGLKEALAMLHEEGLDSVFARHSASRARRAAAVAAWGLENLCENPRRALAGADRRADAAEP
jgi:hypothetical protein